MVKKMVTRLRENDDISNLEFHKRLTKFLSEYTSIKQAVDENSRYRDYTARVLKVVDNQQVLPENIFENDQIKPKYGFYARIQGDFSPHSALKDPCKLYNLDDPKDKDDSQLKLIYQHTFFTTVNSNLSKPQVGSLVKVRLAPKGEYVGLYMGLLIDDSLPAPIRKPKESIEEKSRPLAKKLPINEAKETPFEHETFEPFSNKAKELFMAAATTATITEANKGYQFSNSKGKLPAGIPAEWGDPDKPEGRALHNILKKESQGRVGALNYTYRNALAKRDGYKNGKMPNSDWYGEKYAKTWSHILKRLRKGKNYLGASSTASGLGQMTKDNVRKFYPSGLSGIGDPLEEAAGMLLYIKSRYGTPSEAWAQYGGCSPDGKYSPKHIPRKKRGKPCNPPYDPVNKPGIANTPRPDSPNRKGHDHEGY
jgi:hypothetical protein